MPVPNTLVRPRTRTPGAPVVMASLSVMGYSAPARLAASAAVPTRAMLGAVITMDTCGAIRLTAAPTSIGQAGPGGEGTGGGPHRLRGDDAVQPPPGGTKRSHDAVFAQRARSRLEERQPVPNPRSP